MVILSRGVTVPQYCITADSFPDLQGYGDITPCNEYELIYCTGAMLIGSGLFAYIVGKCACGPSII